MSAVKINVSIDESILDRVDNFREELHLSRSALITAALLDYMNAKQIAPKINAETSTVLKALAELVEGKISSAEADRITSESADRLKAIKDSVPDVDFFCVDKMLE